MTKQSGLEALAAGAVVSPFPRLRTLLDGIAPGHEDVIELTIGEPRGPLPGFLMEKLAAAETQFGKYPPALGTDELRRAIAAWHGRRYGLDGAALPALNADTEILPLNGSREGLFYAVFPAVARRRARGDLGPDEPPIILMPNPFYQTYAGAALAADCEPYYLAATADNRFLPDLEALSTNEALLNRTAAFYLCSPANPQGATADDAYWRQAIKLARRHDFMLFADECYSEIYSEEPPAGALQVAAGDAASSGTGAAAEAAPDAAGSYRFRNVISFNSLSKRSNLPGLRSGFCAGDAAFLATLLELRNLVGPQMPLPTQHASAAIWAEEQHVAVNRQAYRDKFDIADKILGTGYGYRRPGGGFFLWLDMSHWGGGVEATVTLWKECGVKVLPGAFLAQDDETGENPGDDYIRIALVDDAATIEKALSRIVNQLA